MTYLLSSQWDSSPERGKQMLCSNTEVKALYVHLNIAYSLLNLCINIQQCWFNTCCMKNRCSISNAQQWEEETKIYTLCQTSIVSFVYRKDLKRRAYKHAERQGVYNLLMGAGKVRSFWEFKMECRDSNEVYDHFANLTSVRSSSAQPRS